MATVVMYDVDVQDTPYRAYQCSDTVWAIYCTEHRVVFPVEITEEGPLHAVPWSEASMEDLPEDVRESVELYAWYCGVKVVEDGCSH